MKALSYLVLFMNVLFVGCSSLPDIMLKDEDRSSIKSISIRGEVWSPPRIFQLRKTTVVSPTLDIVSSQPVYYSKTLRTLLSNILRERLFARLKGESIFNLVSSIDSTGSRPDAEFVITVWYADFKEVPSLTWNGIFEIDLDVQCALVLHPPFNISFYLPSTWRGAHYDIGDAENHPVVWQKLLTTTDVLMMLYKRGGTYTPPPVEGEELVRNPQKVIDHITTQCDLFVEAFIDDLKKR
jgi:hypothetical protein